MQEPEVSQTLEILNMTDMRSRFFILALAITLLSSAAWAQPPQGSAREQMWPAPTKEDWQKPFQITWQRSWEDAIAVSRATKKPILICVNMDGEIASEHYAGIRYRDPEIAKLYEPYVCVIASTYRHSPRDYDENGNRVPCPRFGGVTCSEHIWIEPFLYEKYFDGKRIAPRHIMVELDGEETYDLYYANDTDSVFKTLADGIAKRDIKPQPQVRGDKSITERVASPDVVDRLAVEKAFAEGNEDLKRALLAAASKLGDKAPLELLRLALASFDEELNSSARKTLAATNSADSADVIADALRAQMSQEEREALITALDRLGKDSPQAKTLALVHRGLGAGAGSVKTKAWTESMATTEEARQAYEESVVSRLERQTELADSEDPKLLLDVAEAQLTRAVESPAEGRSQRMVRMAMFEDAKRNAMKAEAKGAEGWRPNEILAVIAYYNGETEEANTRALAAVKYAPEDASSWNSMVVLGLVGDVRRQQISDAVRDHKEWPKDWLADLNAAYSILSRHPHGNDSQVLTHYDFMMWLRAFAQAEATLEQGLERFPNSALLHDRLRGRLLRRRGAAGIEEGYKEYLAKGEVAPAMIWYAGYGSLVAAEFHRRAGKDEEAMAAYDRGIELYEKAMKASEAWTTSAKHYIAMAHGGKARVAYESKNDKLALKELTDSFEISPNSAATLDGLNLSAVDTAKMLMARFQEEKKTVSLKRLQDALDKLDPSMLQLPAYEDQIRPNPGARGGEGRRGGN